MNLTEQTTQELLRRYKFHVNDRGTYTFKAECNRMYMIQEIGAELRNRGIDPEHPVYAD